MYKPKTIHFRYITDYILRKFPEEIQLAQTDFVDKVDREVEEVDEELQEKIFGFFNEYLTFEHQMINGETALAHYVKHNPDNISSKELDRFAQALKTQYFSQFQIEAVIKNEKLFLTDITTGKKYEVWEKMGASNPNLRGQIFARLGVVDGKQTMLGANSFVIPVVATTRMMKMLRANKKEMQKMHSVTFAASILIATHQNQAEIDFNRARHQLTAQEDLRNIASIRKKLARQYASLAKKYPELKLDFTDLIKMVEREKSKRPLDLIKHFLTPKMNKKDAPKMVELIMNTWNYFPHTALNGKCPVEKIAEQTG